MLRTLQRVIFILVLLSASACTRSASKESTLVIPTAMVAPTVSIAVPIPTTVAPTEIISPTPTSTTAPPDVAGTYAIAFLGKDDLLNLRSAPGLASDVIETLDPFTRDLVPTGKKQEADGQSWLEFQRPNSVVGWLSMRYLTEQVESDAFCSDPRPTALLDGLVQAVTNQDGRLLAKITSPVHGLTIQHNWWNPPVHFEPGLEIENLFMSTTNYDWGKADGSDLPIVGPFKDKILPRMQDVFLSTSATRHCDILETGVSAGGTTGKLNWPEEFTNLNYIAIFRPAPTVEDELNWRTWVAGFEYVGGVPFLVALVQYHWEI